MSLPLLLVTDDGCLSTDWPFVLDEIRRQAEGRFDVRLEAVRPGQSELDLRGVTALALFGGEPSLASLEASVLRVAGAETDGCGIENIEWFWDRGIPFIEATGGWGQSVAELALGLTIAALRRLAHWHGRLAAGWEAWEFPHRQFCDDDRFVNGTVAGKKVGIIGGGAIGGRLALWCDLLGAQVRLHDPFIAPARFAELNAEPASIDEVVETSDILVVAVPPTPSAVNLLDRERIGALPRGAIVVTVTRAAPLDCDALRSRVLRDELVWAADVFDQEPLALDDPLLGRPNVVHTPHIAGRTRDANLAVARMLCDDFSAVVLGGRAPAHPLSAAAVQLRLGAPSLRVQHAPTHK